MKEASIVLFWWLLFGGTHILLSSSFVRPKLIARLGNRPLFMTSIKDDQWNERSKGDKRVDA